MADDLSVNSSKRSASVEADRVQRGAEPLAEQGSDSAKQRARSQLLDVIRRRRQGRQAQEAKLRESSGKFAETTSQERVATKEARVIDQARASTGAEKTARAGELSSADKRQVSSNPKSGPKMPPPIATPVDPKGAEVILDRMLGLGSGSFALFSDMPNADALLESLVPRPPQTAPSSRSQNATVRQPPVSAELASLMLDVEPGVLDALVRTGADLQTLAQAAREQVSRSPLPIDREAATELEAELELPPQSLDGLLRAGVDGRGLARALRTGGRAPTSPEQNDARRALESLLGMEPDALKLLAKPGVDFRHLLSQVRTQLAKSNAPATYSPAAKQAQQRMETKLGVRPGGLEGLRTTGINLGALADDLTERLPKAKLETTPKRTPVGAEKAITAGLGAGAVSKTLNARGALEMLLDLPPNTLESLVAAGFDAQSALAGARDRLGELPTPRNDESWNELAGELKKDSAFFEPMARGGVDATAMLSAMSSGAGGRPTSPEQNAARQALEILLGYEPDALRVLARPGVDFRQLLSQVRETLSRRSAQSQPPPAQARVESQLSLRSGSLDTLSFFGLDFSKLARAMAGRGVAGQARSSALASSARQAQSTVTTLNPPAGSTPGPGADPRGTPVRSTGSLGRDGADNNTRLPTRPTAGRQSAPTLRGSGANPDTLSFNARGAAGAAQSGGSASAAGASPRTGSGARTAPERLVPGAPIPDDDFFNSGGGFDSLLNLEAMDFNWDAFFANFIMRHMESEQEGRKLRRELQRLMAELEIQVHEANIAIAKMRQTFQRNNASAALGRAISGVGKAFMQDAVRSTIGRNPQEQIQSFKKLDATLTDEVRSAAGLQPGSTYLTAEQREALGRSNPEALRNYDRAYETMSRNQGYAGQAAYFTMEMRAAFGANQQAIPPAMVQAFDAGETVTPEMIGAAPEHVRPRLSALSQKREDSLRSMRNELSRLGPSAMSRAMMNDLRASLANALVAEAQRTDGGGADVRTLGQLATQIRLYDRAMMRHAPRESDNMRSTPGDETGAIVDRALREGSVANQLMAAGGDVASIQKVVAELPPGDSFTQEFLRLLPVIRQRGQDTSPAGPFASLINGGEIRAPNAEVSMASLTDQEYRIYSMMRASQANGIAQLASLGTQGKNSFVGSDGETRDLTISRTGDRESTSGYTIESGGNSISFPSNEEVVNQVLGPGANAQGGAQVLDYMGDFTAGRAVSQARQDHLYDTKFDQQLDMLENAIAGLGAGTAASIGQVVDKQIQGLSGQAKSDRREIGGKITSSLMVSQGMINQLLQLLAMGRAR